MVGAEYGVCLDKYGLKGVEAIPRIPAPKIPERLKPCPYINLEVELALPKFLGGMRVLRIDSPLGRYQELCSSWYFSRFGAVEERANEEIVRRKRISSQKGPIGIYFLPNIG